MKNLRFILWSAILCVCAVSLPAATLMEDGRSDYQIVVAENAVPSEVTAAGELRDFLTKISGVTLPIVRQKSAAPAILVGQSAEIAQALGLDDFSRLKPDEIILKTVGNDLILSGSRPRGSLYAVYELLESQFGVRFWSADFMTVPRRTALVLPQLNLRYAPPVVYREAFYDTLQRDPQYAVRMRNNGHFFNIPEDWGGHFTIAGWCHTFGQFLPAEKYFAIHPEWYTERNGRRVPDQLCLSNTTMRAELTRQVLQRLREKPETAFISVSQNDNPNYCTCPVCNAWVKAHGNQTDLLLDAVNSIAAAVNREFPHVKVLTLAYMYTRAVPQTVMPCANVVIQLCGIECNAAYPIESAQNESFAHDVDGWSKIAPALYIWYYTTNFSRYYLPYPNSRNHEADLRLLAAHRTVGLFMQGSGGPGSCADLPELRAYVLSKLMWNPALDQKRLTTEFLNAYYGPAAPEIARYQNLMYDAARKTTAQSCYGETTKSWLDVWHLVAAWKAMETAKHKVGRDPVLQSHVAYAACPIAFALLEHPELFRRREFSRLKPETLIEQTLKTADPTGRIKFSESGDMQDTVRTRLRTLYGVTVNDGVAPEIVAGRSWMGIAATRCELYGGTVGADATAIGGKAVNLQCTAATWAIQLHNLPSGRREIYLELRCDRGADRKIAGAGIYNAQTKKVILEKNWKAAELVGKKYQLVKLDEVDLNENCYFYLGTVNDSSMGSLWVNRIIMIRP